MMRIRFWRGRGSGPRSTVVATTLGTALALLAGALATGAMLALPSAALATVNPPTITSAFTPNVIGVGGTATLAVTITNPNSSALSGVGFSETLPSGC